MRSTLKVLHLPANTNDLAKHLGSWNFDTGNCSVDLGESWVPGPLGLQFSGFYLARRGYRTRKCKDWGIKAGWRKRTV